MAQPTRSLSRSPHNYATRGVLLRGRLDGHSDESIWGLPQSPAGPSPAERGKLKFASPSTLLGPTSRSNLSPMNGSSSGRVASLHLHPREPGEPLTSVESFELVQGIQDNPRYF